MAKVTIRRDNAEFEISDLTFEQVKELVGVNGHSRNSAPVAFSGTPAPNPPTKFGPTNSVPTTFQKPNFHGFITSMSDRGRKFIATLQSHPEGVEANYFAGHLGYKDARQIGGLTGGGLAKAAKKNGIRLKDVYRSEITFPAGQRKVMFYPGKLLLVLDEQKPA